MKKLLLLLSMSLLASAPKIYCMEASEPHAMVQHFQTYERNLNALLNHGDFDHLPRITREIAEFYSRVEEELTQAQQTLLQNRIYALFMNILQNNSITNDTIAACITNLMPIFAATPYQQIFDTLYTKYKPSSDYVAARPASPARAIAAPAPRDPPDSIRTLVRSVFAERNRGTSLDTQRQMGVAESLLYAWLQRQIALAAESEADAWLDLQRRVNDTLAQSIIIQDGIDQIIRNSEQYRSTASSAVRSAADAAAPVPSRSTSTIPARTSALIAQPSITQNILTTLRDNRGISVALIAVSIALLARFTLRR